MRLVQICGAPGVGKSTLLEALGDQALHGNSLRSFVSMNRTDADIEWIGALGGSPQWEEVAEVSLRRAAAIQLSFIEGLAVDAHMPLQRAIGAPPGYLDCIPLPDTAAFCLAPVEVIEARLAERIRSGLKPGRTYDTPAAVRDVRRALEAMTERGAPILVLDMTGAVEVNAAKILSC
jgi:hypothetical protein